RPRRPRGGLPAPGLAAPGRRADRGVAAMTEGFGEAQGGAPMYRSQEFPARGVARVSQELAAWLRMWAVARRHAYVLLRSPPRFFDLPVWPIVATLFFGSLGVFFARQGGPSSSAQASAAYLL